MHQAYQVYLQYVRIHAANGQVRAQRDALAEAQPAVQALRHDPRRFLAAEQFHALLRALTRLGYSL